MSESPSISQTDIENMLLEKYHKNLDRINSLVNVNFLIIAIYLPVIAFIEGYFEANATVNALSNFDPIQIIINSNHSVVSVTSLIVGIICMIISFYLIVIQALQDEHKFKIVLHPTEGDIIQVRTGKELQNHNVNLFSLIDKQNKDYVTSILFTAFSLIFLFNFYIGSKVLLLGLIIFGIVSLSALMRFRNIITTRESQETRIKKLEIQIHKIIEKLDGNINK